MNNNNNYTRVNEIVHYCRQVGSSTMLVKCAIQLWGKLSCTYVATYTVHIKISCNLIAYSVAVNTSCARTVLNQLYNSVALVRICMYLTV